jgi:hypothetical protein
VKPKIRMPLVERVAAAKEWFCTSCQFTRPTEGGAVVRPRGARGVPRFKCRVCRGSELPGATP